MDSPGTKPISGETVLLQALQCQRTGRLSEAEAIYRLLLQNDSFQGVANHNLGALLAQRRDFSGAQKYLKAAIKAEPRRGIHWTSYFEFLFATKQMDGALQIIVEAHRFGLPIEILQEWRRRFSADQIQSLYRMALAYHREGQLAEAGQLYTGLILISPDVAEFHCNLGSVLKEQGAFAEAIAELRQALRIRPDLAIAHYNLGNMLKDSNRFKEAEACYRAAIAADPNFVQAHNNLGHVLRQQLNLADATEAYRAAVAIAPTLAGVHFNLGNILEQQGELAESESAYRCALRLDADYPDAQKHLAAVLCEMGRTAEGLASFMFHAEQTYGVNAREDLPAPQSAHKAKHDREQRQFIVGSVQEDDALITKVLRIDGGERLADRAVNMKNDTDSIGELWKESRPQIVVIDDFLTRDALAELRRLCWGSTFWRQSFDSGYLGASPEHGFATPLLAQISEELGSTYPDIFQRLPLLQLWAFKYDSRLKGVALHADFAAVNVNFWITPDDANLDPESGGLIVWDQAAPHDWDFGKYNGDERTIRAHLERSGARSVKVPYRANRAVIFDSDLFHETDKIVFKEGYLNRRINVTLLYGWRNASRESLVEARS
jgi:tetratricopeptide (TPR) repeat protein